MFFFAHERIVVLQNTDRPAQYPNEIRKEATPNYLYPPVFGSDVSIPVVSLLLSFWSSAVQLEHMRTFLRI